MKPNCQKETRQSGRDESRGPGRDEEEERKGRMRRRRKGRRREMESKIQRRYAYIEIDRAGRKKVVDLRQASGSITNSLD